VSVGRFLARSGTRMAEPDGTIRVSFMPGGLGGIAEAQTGRLIETALERGSDILVVGDVFDHETVGMLLEDLRVLAVEVGHSREATLATPLPRNIAAWLGAARAMGCHAWVIGQGRLDLWSAMLAARVVLGAGEDGQHGVRALDVIYERFFRARDFVPVKAGARKYVVLSRRADIAARLARWARQGIEGAIPDDDPLLNAWMELLGAIVEFPRPKEPVNGSAAYPGHHDAMPEALDVQFPGDGRISRISEMQT
jgi:hypothetical protein